MSQWTNRHLDSGGITEECWNSRTFLRLEQFANGIPTVDWLALLAGIERASEHTTKPHLSLAKSEQATLSQLRSLGHREIRIQRRPDIDSFFCCPNTLAAFRGGFTLVWRPQYVANITQNQHIRLHNIDIKRTKHALFGHGIHCGAAFPCFIAFPDLPVGGGKETFLTEAEQKLWIDDILVPALQASVEEDVAQHSPWSAAEVRYKSKVKREYTAWAGDGSRDIAISSHIPEDCLADFWDRILLRCARVPGFAEPVLWLTGHDLKYTTKRKDRSRLATLQDFVDRLQNCMRWEEGLVEPSECWVDFGEEAWATPDVLTTPTGVATKLVLLRKTHCLDAWECSFRDPEVHRGGRPKAESYFWHLTRDAGTRTFSTALTSSRRCIDGIAHGKAYNVHKEYASSPLKANLDPWGDPRNESIAFTEETVQKMYKLNSRYGRQAHADAVKKSRDRIIRTRNRIIQVLGDRRDATFGIRVELRILLEQLLKLGDGDGDGGGLGTPEDIVVPLQQEEDRDIHSTPPPAHRAFWILDSRDVCEFVLSQVRRWHAVIEILGARTQRAADGPDSDLAAQVKNGLMLSASLRILQVTVSGLDPSRHPALWRESWMQKAKYRGHTYRPITLQPHEGDQHSDSGPRAVQGLALGHSIMHRGMGWIDANLLETGGLAFREDIIPSLALATNTTLRAFKQVGPRKLLFQLGWDEAVAASFREFCLQKRGRLWWRREIGGVLYQDHNRAHRLGAELIIAGFVRELWLLLSSRSKGERGVAACIDDNLLRPLDHLEQQGLRGLSFAMLERVMAPHRPDVVSVQSHRRRGRNGFHLTTDCWVERVGVCFRWTDRSADQEQRRWDTAFAYRTLTRRFHMIIQQTQGPDAAAVFEDVLCAYASRYLLLAPYADSQQLCPMRPKQGNRASTPLQRSRFVLATLPWQEWRRCEDKLGSGWKKNSKKLIREWPRYPPDALNLDDSRIWDGRPSSADSDGRMSFSSLSERTEKQVDWVLIEYALQNIEPEVLGSKHGAGSKLSGWRRREWLDLRDSRQWGILLRLSEAQDFYYGLLLDRGEDDEAVLYRHDSEEDEASVVKRTQDAWLCMGEDDGGGADDDDEE